MKQHVHHGRQQNKKAMQHIELPDKKEDTSHPKPPLAVSSE